MSKNYEDYKPINPQPPRKRKNPALSFVKYAICFLMIVSVAVAALFFVATHSSEMGGGPHKKPTIETSPVTEEQTEPSTDDVTADSPAPDENAINLDLYTNQPIEKSAINFGNLIFVSSNYNVVYPNEADLVKISAQKTGKKSKIESRKEPEAGFQLSFIQLDDPSLLEIRDKILDIDIDTLTPVEALIKLNEIKKIVKKN